MALAPITFSVTNFHLHISPLFDIHIIASGSCVFDPFSLFCHTALSISRRAFHRGCGLSYYDGFVYFPYNVIPVLVLGLLRVVETRLMYISGRSCLWLVGGVQDVLDLHVYAEVARLIDTPQC